MAIAARRARRRHRPDRVVVKRFGKSFAVNGQREEFPKTYGECQDRYPDGVCPWFRCRHGDALEVDERSGALGTNMGRVMTKAPRRFARAMESREPLVTIKADSEVWERRARDLVRATIEADRPTCSLWLATNALPAAPADDEAAYQPARTLEEMGDLENVTRERARQIEVKAMRAVVEELEEIGVDLSNVASVIAALRPEEYGLKTLVIEALKFRQHERTVVVLREAQKAAVMTARTFGAESQEFKLASVLVAIAKATAAAEAQPVRRIQEDDE